jgi:hypothetical protein
MQNSFEIDRQAVADKRAQAASLEMQARRLHREADEIERLLNLALIVRRVARSGLHQTWGK